MPQGFGYGAVGAAFHAAMSVAKGEFGHIAAGAVIGGTAGAAYGAMSDRSTVVGGAMRGALYGGLAGGAVRAARAAHAGYNMSEAAVSSMAAIDPRWGQVSGKWGTAGMAMRMAAKSEYQGLRNLGKASKGFIGSSYSTARGKIGAFTAAREGRRLANRAEAAGEQYAHVYSFWQKPVSAARKQGIAKMRGNFLKDKYSKMGGIRNKNGSVWFNKKLYR